MSKTTKIEIINCALSLLKKEGPESLTQTRVSKLVGVSQGHLTYYFPKKNDLWKVTAEAAFKELKESLVLNLNSKKGVEHLFGTFSENKEQTHLYVSLCLRSQHDASIAHMLNDYFQEVTVLVEAKYPECGQLFLILLWGMGIWEMAGKDVPQEDYDIKNISQCIGTLKQKIGDYTSGLAMSATSLS